MHMERIALAKRGNLALPPFGTAGVSRTASEDAMPSLFQEDNDYEVKVGADGGTRTLTRLPSTDFKSGLSTIPTRPRCATKIGAAAIAAQAISKSGRRVHPIARSQEKHHPPSR